MNLSSGGKSNPGGWKQTDDAKRRISEGNLGKIRSEEHRENYSKPKSAEHANNIKNGMLGVKHTQERVENIRKAANDPVVAGRKSAAMKAYWDQVKSGEKTHKRYNTGRV